MMRSGMTRPFGPSAPFGRCCVAPVRRAEDLRLVDVLQHVVAAAHVAIERGIADAHLRLVAGGQHHRPELVGDRHQDHAADARLDVLLRRVGALAREGRRQRVGRTLRPRLRSARSRSAAEQLRAFFRVVEAVLRGVARRQHHAAHAIRAQRVDRDGGRERGVDAAGQARAPRRESGSCSHSRAGPASSRDRSSVERSSSSATRRPARRPSPSAVRVQSRDDDASLPSAGSARASVPSALHDQRGAVEHEFVLAADLVEIDQRQSAFRRRARRSRLRRTSSLPASKGEPLGTSRISPPVSLRHSTTSGVQMSSQTGTPMRTPRTLNGPGSGPGAKTRFSSNTP